MAIARYAVSNVWTTIRQPSTVAMLQYFSANGIVVDGAVGTNYDNAKFEILDDENAHIQSLVRNSTRTVHNIVIYVSGSTGTAGGTGTTIDNPVLTLSEAINRSYAISAANTNARILIQFLDAGEYTLNTVINNPTGGASAAPVLIRIQGNGAKLVGSAGVIPLRIGAITYPMEIDGLDGEATGNWALQSESQLAVTLINSSWKSARGTSTAAVLGAVDDARGTLVTDENCTFEYAGSATSTTRTDCVIRCGSGSFAANTVIKGSQLILDGVTGTGKRAMVYSNSGNTGTRIRSNEHRSLLRLPASSNVTAEFSDIIVDGQGIVTAYDPVFRTTKGSGLTGTQSFVWVASAGTGIIKALNVHYDAGSTSSTQDQAIFLGRKGGTGEVYISGEITTSSLDYQLQPSTTPSGSAFPHDISNEKGTTFLSRAVRTDSIYANTQIQSTTIEASAFISPPIRANQNLIRFTGPAQNRPVAGVNNSSASAWVLLADYQNTTAPYTFRIVSPSRDHMAALLGTTPTALVTTLLSTAYDDSGSWTTANLQNLVSEGSAVNVRLKTNNSALTATESDSDMIDVTFAWGASVTGAASTAGAVTRTIIQNWIDATSISDASTPLRASPVLASGAIWGASVNGIRNQHGQVMLPDAALGNRYAYGYKASAGTIAAWKQVRCVSPISDATSGGRHSGVEVQSTPADTVLGLTTEAVGTSESTRILVEGRIRIPTTALPTAIAAGTSLYYSPGGSGQLTTFRVGHKVATVIGFTTGQSYADVFYKAPPIIPVYPNLEGNIIVRNPSTTADLQVGTFVRAINLTAERTPQVQNTGASGDAMLGLIVDPITPGNYGNSVAKGATHLDDSTILNGAVRGDSLYIGSNQVITHQATGAVGASIGHVMAVAGNVKYLLLDLRPTA